MPNCDIKLGHERCFAHVFNLLPYSSMLYNLNNWKQNIKKHLQIPRTIKHRHCYTENICAASLSYRKKINSFSVRGIFNCRRSLIETISWAQHLLTETLSPALKVLNLSHARVFDVWLRQCLGVSRRCVSRINVFKNVLSRVIWQNRLPWIWGQQISAKSLYPYKIPHNITSCKTPITNTAVTSLHNSHRATCIREILFTLRIGLKCHFLY
jgi:hypothetical protein